MFMESVSAIFIPFLGTVLGAACVFFLKDKMNRNLQRLLLGFALPLMFGFSFAA